MKYTDNRFCYLMINTYDGSSNISFKRIHHLNRLDILRRNAINKLDIL